MLWIGIWVHPCTVTLLAIKLTQIWVMWGWRGEAMTCWHGWGCTTPLTLPPHLHILYMDSIWACSYAVDRHMGSPLHCYTAGQLDPEIWVIWGWWDEINTCWHGWGCRIQLTSSPCVYCMCMYRKCLSMFICCVDRHMGWMHPYTVTRYTAPSWPRFG